MTTTPTPTPSTVATASNTATATATTTGDLQPVVLKTPLQTPTGTVLQITLRRAKVRDLKEAQRVATTEADQELQLLARLSQEKLTAEDLEELDLADYAQVQQQFRQMLGTAG